MEGCHLPDFWEQDEDGDEMTEVKWTMLVPFDLRHDPKMDLLNPEIIYFVKSVVMTGRVLFTHQGTPCSSFTLQLLV